MYDEIGTLNENNIKDKIHTLRGIQVMLDGDLANLYEVETKQINRAVRRNKERFPDDFCFQLNDKEFTDLRYHFGTANISWNKKRYYPYAFTEHGVTALSGVLKSRKAVEINIKIIKAFVAMRHFLIQNANVFFKFQQIDQKLLEHDTRLDKVFKAIEEKHITPKQGIFFDGQVFDAYIFASDLIKSAEKSIILVDNYIDDTVLRLLSKKKQEVKVNIYTATISEQLELDKDKFNRQYGKLEIKKFMLSHDRFLIIDSKRVYHIGASLKDLGKRWFAFSRFNTGAIDMLARLK